MLEGKPCSIIGDTARVEYMYAEDAQVYYWRYGQFRRIYDFSAAQGDTVQLTYPVSYYDGQGEILDTVIDVRARVDSVWPNADTPMLTSFLIRVIPDTAYPTIDEYAWPEFTYTERIGSHGMMIDHIIAVATVAYFADRLRCYADVDTDHVESWWAQQSKPCDYQLSTGITNDPDADALLVYPNPATDMLHITSKQSLTELRIMDTSGRQCIQFPLSKGMPAGRGIQSRAYDISHLPSGIYLLEAWDAQGRRTVQRVAVH